MSLCRGRSYTSKTVSVGVCAYNEARRIRALLESLAAQGLPPDFTLMEIIVVASGCTDKTADIVQEHANSDSKVVLIQEPQRRGKASAINIILGRYRGDLLVLVNADARIMPGSLRALIETFDRNEKAQIVCGSPIPEPSFSPMVSLVEDVWWRLHNRTLDRLAALGGGNHCCDEFMAIKRGFSDSIPPNVICDGSYFGVLGAIRGTTVQFSVDAAVIVETPSTLSGILKQRRRNLRGHWQVARLLGQPPRTLETLVRKGPGVAAHILASELASRPLRTIAFLVVALPLEVLAHSLAHLDGAVNREDRPVWPMVE